MENVSENAMRERGLEYIPILGSHLIFEFEEI